MGIISKVTSYVPILNKVKSVYSVGKKIKNHIYTRRNFLLLIKKHNFLLEQLEKANEVAIFYAKLQKKCLEEPVTCYNFNKAFLYCTDYGLPLEVKEDSIKEIPTIKENKNV